MEDGSRSLINDLKKEWRLFWNRLADEGFTPETDPSKNPPIFSADVSHDQIQEIIRNLSRQRHEIHQKLEMIQKDVSGLEEQLEELPEKASTTLVERLNTLNDLGHKWSQALNVITEQLKFAREKENEFAAMGKAAMAALGRRAEWF